jgi:hypothetical protein
VAIVPKPPRRRTVAPPAIETPPIETPLPNDREASDPVGYMLAVMGDAEAEPARRDGMAKAVASYLRPKASAGRADARELLDAAVAGAKASLARKLARLAPRLP